jgi:hypothetical protein
VADVTTCNKIDYVLGDIRGVIADALKILGHQNEFECRENDSGIFHHVGEKLAEELVAKAINLIVALEHTLRKILIAANECVQTVPNHAFGKFAHAGEIHVRLHLGVAHHAHGGVRDVHRLVADAFDVAVDSRNSQKKTEVGGHRSLQGQLSLYALVDLNLHFVDGILFVEDRFRETFIGIENGVHGLMDGSFGEATHPKQALLQFFEIVFPVAFHGVTPISVGIDPAAKACA